MNLQPKQPLLVAHRAGRLYIQSTEQSSRQCIYNALNGRAPSVYTILAAAYTGMIVQSFLPRMWAAVNISLMVRTQTAHHTERMSSELYIQSSFYANVSENALLNGTEHPLNCIYKAGCRSEPRSQVYSYAYVYIRHFKACVSEHPFEIIRLVSRGVLMDRFSEGSPYI